MSAPVAPPIAVWSPLYSFDVAIEDLDEAILRTIAYADVFDYPLTSQEIHRYLIGHAAPAAVVEDRLAHTRLLREQLGSLSPLWFLAGRENLVALRQEREGFAASLWPVARRYGQCIAALPFVRMLGFTGALAMNNVSGPHDDIDLLVVTQSGRIWLSRGLIVVLVRLAQRQRVNLCPNYILSEHSLELGERDLFTAHELVQMVPFNGSSLYQRLLDTNAWLTDFLPNASARAPVKVAYGRMASLGQRGSELLLAGHLGDAVERWERERKIPRLRLEAAQSGGDGATFTPDVCKGHMADHASLVRRRYTARLAALGL